MIYILNKINIQISGDKGWNLGLTSQMRPYQYNNQKTMLTWCIIFGFGILFVLSLDYIFSVYFITHSQSIIIW